MTGEEWRPIPGHPWYQASSLGRVRSVPRFVTRSDGIVARYRSRILAPAVVGAGYESVKLAESGRVTTYRVHALVAMAFHGPRPPGLFACHNNGNSLDNRSENIRWGTPSDNMYDRVQHGMHFRTWRTHCPRGHALKEPNLVKSRLRAGRRNCRACDQASTYISQQLARGGRPPTLQAESDERYRKILKAG